MYKPYVNNIEYYTLSLVVIKEILSSNLNALIHLRHLCKKKVFIKIKTCI